MIDDVLLKIVKESIYEEFDTTCRVDKTLYTILYPNLKEIGATFITINKSSSLRGCIGSLVAHRPLIDDLIQNAKSAAFKDPRFPSLSLEEFQSDTLSLEISVLSTPKELIYSDIDDLKKNVRVGHHGVILTLENNRATFLPQVWEQLPSFEIFFNHLCQKAGLSGDCLENFPKIELYEVKKIK